MSNRCSHPIREALPWQPALFDAADAPTVDPSFARVERRMLDEHAWVDHLAGWVHGAPDLFDAIVTSAPWTHRTVPMYGRMVEEPRLVAWYGTALDDRAIPEVVPAIAAALSRRYEREFDGVGAALYRDGRDSVAWHADRAPRSPAAAGASGESRATHEHRIPLEVVDPIVAIVSLGSPRRLLMRPKGGGHSVAFPLFPGDLLVMGGRSQRTWEHCVPKVARAGPRLSLQFRHSG